MDFCRSEKNGNNKFKKNTSYFSQEVIQRMQKISDLP